MTFKEILIYAVREGRFHDHAGPLLYQCYSGKKGEWRNNPAVDHEHNHGPIPRGRWQVGQPYNSARVGPIAIPLTPCATTRTHGRSAFLIHGDNAEGDASEGCIIAPRAFRTRLASALACGASPVLYVVAEIDSLRTILQG